MVVTQWGQFDERQAKVHEKYDKKHNDLSRDFGEKSGQWEQRQWQWQWRCCRRTPRSSQFEPSELQW